MIFKYWKKIVIIYFYLFKAWDSQTRRAEQVFEVTRGWDGERIAKAASQSRQDRIRRGKRRVGLEDISLESYSFKNYNFFFQTFSRYLIRFVKNFEVLSLSNNSESDQNTARSETHNEPVIANRYDDYFS